MKEEKSTFNLHKNFPLHKSFFIVEKIFFRLLKHSKKKVSRLFEEPNVILQWHHCKNSLLEHLLLKDS